MLFFLSVILPASFPLIPVMKSLWKQGYDQPELLKFTRASAPSIEHRLQRFAPSDYATMRLPAKYFPATTILLLGAACPEVSSAHVKWFVTLSDEMPAGYLPYQLSEPAVLFWLALAITLVAASVWLNSRLPTLAPLSEKTQHVIITLLRFLTGFALMLSAARNTLIAPHYVWDGPFPNVLLAGEFFIGCFFMFNRLVFASSLLLLTLYLVMLLKFGVMELLEYLNIAGIALFLAMQRYPTLPVREKLLPYALPLLRISTGFALVVLGFSEKLLRPDFAQRFVETYMWNFMSNMGFTAYSDRLFVLSAGTMEVVFGLILILGTTTRLNIVVISAFMFTSNLTFFLEGNITQATIEIIGHLPVIAIAIICVFFGAGQKFTITSMAFKRKKALTQPLSTRD